MTNLGFSIYGGMAKFGRIEAILTAIVSSSVGLILLLVGAFLIRKKQKRTSSVNGTITNVPTCIHNVTKSKDVIWSCTDMAVKYMVKGKSYSIKVNTKSLTKYTQNDNIEIYYDPANPANASNMSGKTHMAGWLLVLFGIIIISGSWVWVWITHKSKFAAAYRVLA